MKKPDKTEEPSKIVKNEETKPCGCHVVVYSDETAMVTPCIPCGLMECAGALNGAAQALAAVGNRLRMEQNQAAMAQAVQAASRKVQRP